MLVPNESSLTLEANVRAHQGHHGGTLSLKARSDLTRCVLCNRVFRSDDEREDLEEGFTITGTIHKYGCP